MFDRERAGRRGEPAAADTPWLLPDEPVPVRLMNTVWADRHGVHEALGAPGDLAAWLYSVGASDSLLHATAADLARALSLRDGLRRLAALCTSDTRTAAQSAIADLDAAVVAVNASAAAGLVAPRLEVRDGSLRCDATPLGPPVAASLGAVAADAIKLLAGPEGSQLRACQAPGCVLYFVKQHARREWCSVACGNRARAARHYRRHRVGESAGEELPRAPPSLREPMG